MNKYIALLTPTQEMLEFLLAQAYENEQELDKLLSNISFEISKEIKRIIKENNIDKTKIDIYTNKAILDEINQIELLLTERANEMRFLWYNLLTFTLSNTYKETYKRTTNLLYTYNHPGQQSAPFIPQTRILDTYITSHYLQIPWCQDGKTYSDRLYGTVANFQKKLDYILKEGIINGKGEQWMIDSWKKLTNATAYEASRLIKTETVAMWSQSTKDAYLDNSIEYVEIIGDAHCGEICTDYVGKIIKLEGATLGDELPPYHPNCACDFIAYEESED